MTKPIAKAVENVPPAVKSFRTLDIHASERSIGSIADKITEDMGATTTRIWKSLG
jgi:hypothetical protein